MTYSLTTHERNGVITHMNRQDEVLQQLPLTETTFLVLLSLSSGKKHGYLIMQDVERLSEGRISLGTGTLYGALGRLLDQGWIERVDEEQESGRPRKVYALSDLGRRILEAEAERLRSLLSAARLRLAEADV
jgi:DNA-binding PadR family transcriptional regulator